MEQRRPQGRPTTYDEAVARAVCARIACGCTPHHAGLLEGVPDRTLRNWLDRHPEFALMVERAKSEHVALNLARINTAAGNGSWKAAVWLAEHADPHYRPVPQRLEIEGSLDINVRVDQLSDDELDQYIDSGGREIPNRLGPGRERAPTPQEDQDLAS